MSLGVASRDRLTSLSYYLYGIVTAEITAEAVDAAGAALITDGELGAVVTAFDPDAPPRPAAQVRAHGTLLDAIAEHGPIIPAQYGTILRDDDDVVEMLREQVETAGALLRALTDRRQFRVRGLYNEEVVLGEVVQLEPEIEHLDRLTRDLPDDQGRAERMRLGELVAAALQRRREADAALILDEVLPCAVAFAERERSETDHVLDVAVLVDDDDRAAFEETLESLAEGMHPHVRLQLTGPMAPYDFVDGDWWV